MFAASDKNEESLHSPLEIYSVSIVLHNGSPISMATN